MEKDKQPTYLGDALYGTIRDGILILTTDHHEPEKAGCVILLEQSVLDNLLAYVKPSQ